MSFKKILFAAVLAAAGMTMSSTSMAQFDGLYIGGGFARFTAVETAVDSVNNSSITFGGDQHQGGFNVNAGLGGHVQVVAYDATKAAIELMNNGVVTLVLAQKPFDMGYLGVQFAQADAAGVTSLPRRVQTGFAIIDKQNVKDPAIARFIYQTPG